MFGSPIHEYYIQYKFEDITKIAMRRNLFMGNNMFNPVINNEVLKDLFYLNNTSYVHVKSDISLNDFLKKMGIEKYTIKQE